MSNAGEQWQAIRVLVVVEDDVDMQRLIAATLGRDPRMQLQGQVANAEAALDVLNAFEPGVIILDHGLAGGGLTGIEAAPKLKAAAPQSKIVLFTAYDLGAEAAREPAIDAFLSKDDIGQLLATVQEMVGLLPLSRSAARG